MLSFCFLLLNFLLESKRIDIIRKIRLFYFMFKQDCLRSRRKIYWKKKITKLYGFINQML